MKDHIVEMLSVWLEEFKCIATNSTKKDMFTIDKTVLKLDIMQVGLFHSIVYTILWVMKRGHLNIDVSISFLMTRVVISTMEYWGKLERVFIFLHGTVND